MQYICRFLGRFPFLQARPIRKSQRQIFFGVDFFEPSKGFLRYFETNHLKASRLANPLKTRVFSAKSFLVENFRNMRAFSSFWETTVLIFFKEIPYCHTPQIYCDSCCGSESLLGARPIGPHRAPAETPTHNMSGLHLGRGCSF